MPGEAVGVFSVGAAAHRRMGLNMIPHSPSTTGCLHLLTIAGHNQSVSQ